MADWDAAGSIRRRMQYEDMKRREEKAARTLEMRRGSRGTRSAKPSRREWQVSDPAQQRIGEVVGGIAGPIDNAMQLASMLPAWTAPGSVARVADMYLGGIPEAAQRAAEGEPGVYWTNQPEPVTRQMRGQTAQITPGPGPTGDAVELASMIPDVAAVGTGAIKGIGAGTRGFVDALAKRAGPVGDVVVPNAGAELQALAASIGATPQGQMAIIDRINTLPGQISTRQPPKTSPEFGELTDLTVSYDAAKRDLDALAHNAALMELIPGIKPSAGLTDPVAKAENVITQEKDNLLYLWDRAKQAGRLPNREWYVGANKLAQDFAAKYGTTPEGSAGAIAALSPQNLWDQNVQVAERLMSIRKNPPAYSGAMDSQLSEIQKSLSPKQKGLVDEVRGKEYSQLTNNRQRAVWIRAADEASSDRRMRAVLPDGTYSGFVTNKDGTPRRIGWNQVGEIEKALNILDDPTEATLSANLGNAHKVRTFYNNIIRPESLRDEAVMDTHSVGAATLLPVGPNSWPVSHVLGKTQPGIPGPKSPALSGMSGIYPLQQEAYIRAAREAGAMPREMQSVTWEEIRDMFPAQFKKHDKEGVRKLQEAHDAYAAGRLSRREVINLLESVPAKYRKRP